MGGKNTTKVLLVEAETAERERLGDLLERAGFDVVECPGPSGPDYTCVGGREGRCALVEPADIVVLDLWLESDTMLYGTQSGELIGLYLSSGKPVVTLGSQGAGDHGLDDDPVARLPRMPSPEELLGAVRALARGLAPAQGP